MAFLVAVQQVMARSTKLALDNTTLETHMVKHPLGTATNVNNFTRPKQAHHIRKLNTRNPNTEPLNDDLNTPILTT